MTDAGALQTSGARAALSLELLTIAERIRERLARTYYDNK